MVLKKFMLDRQTISTKLKSKQILTVLLVFVLSSTIIVDLTLSPIETQELYYKHIKIRKGSTQSRYSIKKIHISKI